MEAAEMELKKIIVCYLPHDNDIQNALLYFWVMA